MRFDLLGPPTVRKNGRTLHIGGPIHQLVLAILLTEPRFIATESLIGLIWPADDPDVAVPREPRPRLYEVVSDLRRALREAGCDPDDLLPSQRGGYRAQVQREQVDLLRYHDGLRAAHASQEADEPDKAVRQYREAFREWHAEIGLPTVEPYAGLTGRWVRNQRERLLNAYRTDLVACIDLELRLGRYDRLVPELVSLNAAHPLDERIARLLMLARHGSGQTAESLATYTRIRERLAEELGTEPGDMLQELHRKVLRQDQALLVPGEPNPPFQKGQVVNDHYTNRVDGTVNGSLVQAANVYGSISFGSPAPGAGPIAQAVSEFRGSVRAATRAGELPAHTATAVQAELARALSGDDDFADVMEGIRHLVDGAPDLVAHADQMIDLARRGAR
jgi:DNA-binding SARP family transcriptional activator